MKRIFLAVACVAGLVLAGNTASAQGPVQGVVSGHCSTCGASTASKPSFFSRLAFWKSSCSTCGHQAAFRTWTNNAAGMPRGNPGAAMAFNPYPQGTPGTLVFPQHPFVRSPRDYFMADAK